jgi:cell wall-associated NlpC family hydrolase
MLDQNQQENIKNLGFKDFINLAIGVPFLDHGRDFQGWDCWGLAVRLYRECFGMDIQDFEGLTGLNSRESEKLFEDYRHAWLEINSGKENSGDLVIMRGSVIHVGVVVKPGMMLHTENNYGTCVEPYTSGIWKTRVIGLYRHAELAG